VGWQQAHYTQSGSHELQEEGAGWVTAKDHVETAKHTTQPGHTTCSSAGAMQGQGSLCHAAASFTGGTTTRRKQGQGPATGPACARMPHLPQHKQQAQESSCRDSSQQDESAPPAKGLGQTASYEWANDGPYEDWDHKQPPCQAALVRGEDVGNDAIACSSPAGKGGVTLGHGLGLLLLRCPHSFTRGCLGHRHRTGAVCQCVCVGMLARLLVVRVPQPSIFPHVHHEVCCQRSC
jgi:hypothetical protein